MANLYGVANAPGIPSLYTTIGGADVVANAGVETNFINAGPLVAPSNGFFYPIAWIGLQISTGATAPTGLNIGLRVNNGADQTNISVAAYMLPLSANLLFFYSLPGSASQTPWQGAGSNVQISCTASGQGITVRNAGTWVMIGLFRAPDQ